MVKNKEVMSIDDIFVKIQTISTELEMTIIPKLSKIRAAYFDEWNKFDSNSKPNIKVVEKAIKDAMPIYKEYLAKHQEIRELQAKLTSLTGVKEKDIKQLYDVWNAFNILNKAN